MSMNGHKQSSVMVWKDFVETRELILKEKDSQDREKRWGHILSTEEIVTEEVIERVSGLSRSCLGEFGDTIDCVMEDDSPFGFMLEVTKSKSESILELWSACQRAKQLINEYFYDEIGEELEEFASNIKDSFDKEKFKGLTNSATIFELIIREYSGIARVNKDKIFPRVNYRNAQFYLFIWLFIAHNKKWEGTAAELFGELSMYSCLSSYRLRIGSSSALSKILGECKDFLRAIGVGCEYADGFHKIWLIDSEV